MKHSKTISSFLRDLRNNGTPLAILLNMLLAAASLFVNGFGIYLTIQANLGAAPGTCWAWACPTPSTSSMAPPPSPCR